MATEERLNENGSAGERTIHQTRDDLAASRARPACDAQGIPWPRWKCHKEVRAAKIVSVSPRTWGLLSVLTLEIEPKGPLFCANVQVTQAWMAKHQPMKGGYYVLYEDGYASFSPAAAFESGYTRIE